MDVLNWALASSIVYLPLYVAILIVTICFVIFFHELGHYVMARLFCVKIEKFSIGFGREILGRVDRSGTRWSLSWIPLGGYVQLFGYVNALNPKIYDKNLDKLRLMNEQERSYAFCFKPLWQRFLIVAMGPIFNFALALIILTFVFMARGESSSPPLLTAIAKNTAAEKAGLKPLDRLIEVNGTLVARLEDFWSYTNIAGTRVQLKIERQGEILEKVLTSRAVSYKDAKGIMREHGRSGAVNFLYIDLKNIRGVNGHYYKHEDIELSRTLILEGLDQPMEVSIDLHEGHKPADIFQIHPLSDMNTHLNLNQDAEDHEGYNKFYIGRRAEPFYVRHDLISAIKFAGIKIYKFLDEGIRFLSVVLFDRPEKLKIGGLGTMTEYTEKAVDKGLYTFLLFVAVFSVQIGFINLMPIPVLDGGYLLFFCYEAFTGKPLPEKVQDYTLSIGLVLLVGIMVLANLSDLFRAIF